MAETKAKTADASDLATQVEALAQRAIDQIRALSELGPEPLNQLRHSLSTLDQAVELAEHLLSLDDEDEDNEPESR